jgi:hypothetical protein
LEKPEKVPEWLTIGITYLLPKLGDNKEVRKYRPITCLSTMYKTITGIITKRISTQLAVQNLLPEEQKGCQPGSKGFKDKVLISASLYGYCKRRNKDLSIAWINCQRAFDSFPHSWVENLIEMVGVDSNIVNYQWRNGTQRFM